MIAPARKAAYEVIRRVFEEEAYADRALDSAVAGLDPRDRALAQRLAYGTVQRARTLDFGIDQNESGTLDLSEITGTRYVCNGAAGAASPASIIL